MTRMFHVAVLLFSVLFILVPSGLAVDGVTLITQASATNGLPGCPHSGFPIQICQPGSYRLASNIVSDSDAIAILADNVTLDLNGFAIVGNGAVGSGVRSPNSNINISNGRISGFLLGINLAGDSECVERVTLTANAGGFVAIGKSNLLDRVIVRSNGLGIQFHYPGTGMITNSIIANNVIGISPSVSVGYGGNTFIQNAEDVSSSGPSTSLGNNVCSNNVKC